MSNQDNQGLSIFDDDEPETGSTSEGTAGAADRPTPRRRR